MYVQIIHTDSDLAYIDCLISAHGFVFIQETWLCEDRLDIFSNNLNNVFSHGVSGMDSNQPLRVNDPKFGMCYTTDFDKTL